MELSIQRHYSMVVWVIYEKQSIEILLTGSDLLPQSLQLNVAELASDMYFVNI